MCCVHVAGLDFTGMPFDVAFRYLLTNGGFFLPGEAQKIDRVTQGYIRRCYAVVGSWADNQ